MLLKRKNKMIQHCINDQHYNKTSGRDSNEGVIRTNCPFVVTRGGMYWVKKYGKDSAWARQPM